MRYADTHPAYSSPKPLKKLLNNPYIVRLITYIQLQKGKLHGKFSRQISLFLVDSACLFFEEKKTGERREGDRIFAVYVLLASIGRCSATISTFTQALI